MQAKLGPWMGRWNEFMRQNWGDADPEFAGIKTALGLINTQAMRAHVGLRGGTTLVDRFDSYANAGKMTPATLAAGLGELRNFMVSYEGLRHRDVSIGDTNTPAGISVFVSGGKTYHIPSGEVDNFKRDHPDARAGR